METILNTVEMLREIKVGQVAKCLDKDENMFGVKRLVDGIYWVKSEDERNSNVNDGSLLSMTDLVIEEYMWKLCQIKEEVSFDEAMMLLKEGYTIQCIVDENKYQFDVFSGDRNEFILLQKEAILTGRWFILK